MGLHQLAQHLFNPTSQGDIKTKSATLFIAAAFASFVAGAATAQTTAFGNQDRVTDAIDDIEEDGQDSFDRDVRTFGNEGRTLGFTGSISARATATDGNTDTADIGLGARVGRFGGLYVQISPGPARSCPPDFVGSLMQIKAKLI